MPEIPGPTLHQLGEQGQLTTNDILRAIDRWLPTFRLITEELTNFMHPMINWLQIAEECVREHQQSPILADISELDMINQELTNNLRPMYNRYNKVFRKFMRDEKPNIPRDQWPVQYTQMRNMTRNMIDHFRKLNFILSLFEISIEEATEQLSVVEVEI